MTFRFLTRGQSGLFLLAAISMLPTLTSALEPSSTPSFSVKSKAHLTEFVRAQKVEGKVLEIQLRAELREFKALQKTKLQEWEKQEREARHKFFEDHPKGAERRVYIKDFLQRRDEFQQEQKEEYKARMRDQEQNVEKLRSGHAQSKKEFEQFISSGQNPPASLWPKIRQ